MIVGPSMPTPIASMMPGTPARAISWLEITCSSGPRPWPPYSFGHVSPTKPASASWRCQARWATIAASSSSMAPSPRRTGASSLCSSSHARTFARYSACSGLSFRSKGVLLADWPISFVGRSLARRRRGVRHPVMRGVQAGGEMSEMVALARPRATQEEQRGDGGGDGDRREDAVGGREGVDRRVAGLDGEVPARAGPECGHGLARAVGGAGHPAVEPVLLGRSRPRQMLVELRDPGVQVDQAADRDADRAAQVAAHVHDARRLARVLLRDGGHRDGGGGPRDHALAGADEQEARDE